MVEIQSIVSISPSVGGVWEVKHNKGGDLRRITIKGIVNIGWLEGGGVDRCPLLTYRKLFGSEMDRLVGESLG